jgi:hypothetical protein
LTAAGLALTGCGAGTNAQTSEMVTAISGVDVDAGELALRDMQIDFGEHGLYRAGGQAPLRVWIDNRGDEPVVLEAVTSSAAEAVTLASEFVLAEEEETPEGESPSPDEDESPTPEADGSESPTGDATESPDADAASPTGDAAVSEAPESQAEEAIVAEFAGERDFEIEIGPSSYVRLAPSTGSFLLLEGLEEDLTMGSTVEITFVFSNGQAVTVDLPMGVPEEAPSRSYFEPRHGEGAE